MKTTTWVAILAAVAITATMFATNAGAQALHTWVSGTGDDSNPCTRTAPCQTFAGAILKTANAGEIGCLDAADFETVTINKAITIDCQGVGAGISAVATFAISVNAPAGASIQLVGLDLNGAGGVNSGTPGTNGVQVLSNSNVSIINCVISGFQQTPGGGGGLGGTGVYLANTAAGAHVDIENTYIRNNAFGVTLSGTAAGSVLVDHSVLESNVTSDLRISTAFDTTVLQASTLAGAPTAIDNTGGATVISYGNNLIRNPGAPTETLPLQ